MGAPPTTAPGIDPILLEPVLAVPFMMWAKAADNEALELNPAERRALAVAAAPVVDKWMPAGTAGPEAMLILAAAPILMAKASAAAKGKKRERVQARRDPEAPARATARMDGGGDAGAD